MCHHLDNVLLQHGAQKSDRIQVGDAWCVIVPTCCLMNWCIMCWIVCSSAGIKFSTSSIFIACKSLLDRFESGDLILPKCLDIVSSLLRDTTAYRNGTLSRAAKKLIAARKAEYVKMISDCRSELQSAAAKKSNAVKHKVIVTVTCVMCDTCEHY